MVVAESLSGTAETIGSEDCFVLDSTPEINATEDAGAPSAYDFDMLVMGSGPAGQRAAIQSSSST